MSTPQQNTPDKTAPQHDQSEPVKKPGQLGDDEKQTANEGVHGDAKMNLASKSNSKQGWKGIG